MPDGADIFARDRSWAYGIFHSEKSTTSFQDQLHIVSSSRCPWVPAAGVGFSYASIVFFSRKISALGDFGCSKGIWKNYCEKIHVGPVPFCRFSLRRTHRFLLTIA